MLDARGSKHYSQALLGQALVSLGAYLKHLAGAWTVRNFLVRQPALSIRAEVAHVAENFYG